MRISFIIAATATLVIPFTSAADAQIADKRSFFHPLGFWSNHYYVRQREVYPPVSRTGHVVRPFVAYPDLTWHSRGGGLLYERNW